MCEKQGLCVDVQQLDDIVVTDDTAATRLWECLGGNNLPLVVRVFVAVSSDLLT